jgi:proteasome assembly chaperone (PAC2) family protein
MKGFCLLAETTGAPLDIVAAKAVMEKLNFILGLNVELTNLEKAADDVDKHLGPLRNL